MINPKINSELPTQRRRSGISLTIDTTDEIDKSFYLQNKLKSRTASIKSCLLNQSIIAGLGNIYTDEILWKIKVHPNSRANMLKVKLLKELIGFLVDQEVCVLIG